VCSSPQRNIRLGGLPGYVIIYEGYRRLMRRNSVYHEYMKTSFNLFK
jgi:hypothetical protein